MLIDDMLDLPFTISFYKTIGLLFNEAEWSAQNKIQNWNDRIGRSRSFVGSFSLLIRRS